MALGYLAISAAAVLWAVGATVARILIDRGASVIELTEARAWIAAAGLALLVGLRRGRALAPRPGPRPAPVLVVAFGLSLAAANLTYYVAVGLLPVAVAIVVQYTAPGLVVVWSALVRRQRPSRRVVGALGVALAGVALLSEAHLPLTRAGSGLRPAGLAAAAGASVAFAAYMVLGERLGRALGAGRAVLSGFLVASLFWGAVQTVRGRPDTLLDLGFLPMIAFLGIFTTLVPFLLFVWGMGRVNATRAGIISTLEPLAAAAIAFVWLGQRLGASQVAGGVLVVAGIALVQWDRPQPAEVLEERAAVE